MPNNGNARRKIYERDGRTTSSNGSSLPFPQSKSDPLVTAQSTVAARILEQVEAQETFAKAQLAITQAKNDAQIARCIGMVAAINSAMPVLDKVVGDPNRSLDTLAEIVSLTGRSIVEEYVEITIDDLPG